MLISTSSSKEDGRREKKFGGRVVYELGDTKHWKKKSFLRNGKEDRRLNREVALLEVKLHVGLGVKSET